MGFGSYQASDWSKLKQSRKIDSAANETEIFTRREIDPRFDPRFIERREARDSEDHPNSTPIIIGLDVTASMGYLSNQIAKESLHETMMKLYSLNSVEDPALMFAAYGDHNDAAPLQVTQFESDIRIAEQLMDLWLENGGQGMVCPDYLWYFAAEHTDLDSFKKHNKKGFLFTIGDQADCRELDPNSFMRVFGEGVRERQERTLAKCSEKFEVFHIFVSESAVSNNGKRIKSMLPGHIIKITPSDITALPEIIISTMEIMTGKDKKASIAQWDELVQPTVENALKNIAVVHKKKGLFF